MPKKIPLSVIQADFNSFQVRTADITESHVVGLQKAVTRGDPLEAITVWSTEAGPIVLDGHHRLEAYHRAKWKNKVPVVYLEGTFEEAKRFSYSANLKDKLVVTPEAKSNAAWWYATNTKDSLRAIETETGISRDTISRMRKAATTLIEMGIDPHDHTSWRAALGESQGLKPYEMPDGFEEVRAKEWCRRLSKAFGHTAQGQNVILAMALELYLGRHFDGFVDYLTVKDGDDGSEYDDDF